MSTYLVLPSPFLALIPHATRKAAMSGKGGFLTPKAIANRIKAKGLQKLRWYCEMCHKQCRDENGFKCHTMSESHMRQMQVFRENPLQIMENFSKDFEVKSELQWRGSRTRGDNLVYVARIVPGRAARLSTPLKTFALSNEFVPRMPSWKFFVAEGSRVSRRTPSIRYPFPACVAVFSRGF